MRLEGSENSKRNRLWEVLKVSTLLGITSFGGPIAHLGHFHREYVQKRKWIDEHSYADLVALCQFLPGPASSQVGIGIGTLRAGMLGGFFAWIGFTAPSAIALILFADLLKTYDLSGAGWIHGLKVVAVAIVAHAVLSMGQKLASERTTATIAVLSAAVVVSWQTAYTQVLVIILSGIAGVFLFGKPGGPVPNEESPTVMNHRSLGFLGLFFFLLLALPVAREWLSQPMVALFDSFYRSGSLVFGGGHVVLPLLEMELVPTGWISQEDFLAGYGATQAVPGPLFTFSGYLGAVIAGNTGAIVALVGVFLPSFLLVLGVLPYWENLRKNSRVKAALISINASVVGILLAALYNPLWTTAILNPSDFVLVMLLFGLLVYWKLPPWLIVILGAMGGILFGAYPF